jgi:hypothetical protein
MFAGRHLPDRMFVTLDQFRLLEDDVQRIEETKARIYLTPYNVMEVEVVT